MRVPGRYWWGWWAGAALSGLAVVACWGEAYALYRVGSGDRQFLVEGLAGMHFLGCMLLTPLCLLGVWYGAFMARRTRTLYHLRRTALAEAPTSTARPTSMSDSPHPDALPFAVLIRDSALRRVSLLAMAFVLSVGLSVGFWLPWSLVLLPPLWLESTPVWEVFLAIYGPALVMFALVAGVVLLRRPHGIVVGAQGVETRSRIWRSRRLSWRDMRFLEHDLANGRYLLYGTETFLTWPEPKQSHDETPIGITWEEAIVLGRTVLEVVEEHTGLAPQVLTRQQHGSVA